MEDTIGAGAMASLTLTIAMTRTLYNKNLLSADDIRAIIEDARSSLRNRRKQSPNLQEMFFLAETLIEQAMPKSTGH
ncbi:MAG: hypothetical protein IT539_13835 [Bradyrhizobiaceae bacterium]|nr:hypothetical protein [Bradyrhizobiaceae bacterium]